MQGLRIDTDAGVRVLTLDRPERLNALSQDLVAAIAAAVTEAGADPGLGAVLLTGTGRAFSAGGDIAGMGAAGSEDEAVGFLEEFQAMLLAIWQSPLPVLACVNGLAYGAGFNLVLGCDLVIASAGAVFCQAFTRIGLAPDLGGTWTLPRAVGRYKTLELMLLNPTVSADEAQALGLVTRVAPDADAALEQAMTLARQLAAGPREAQARTKRLVNDSTGLGLEASLRIEATTQAALLVGAESVALRRSFLDR